MIKSKKNKKVEEVKELKPITEVKETKTEKTEEVLTQPVTEAVEVKPKRAPKKDYVVVLGTPSFYVIKLNDGTMKTIQGSNKYRRGDIVRL